MTMATHLYALSIFEQSHFWTLENLKLFYVLDFYDFYDPSLSLTSNIKQQYPESIKMSPSFALRDDFSLSPSNVYEGQIYSLQNAQNPQNHHKMLQNLHNIKIL